MKNTKASKQPAASDLSVSAGYVCFPDGMNLTIQPKRYIEDGWRIKVIGGMYRVFEIPQYGGKEYHLQDFVDAEAAFDLVNSLT